MGWRWRRSRRVRPGLGILFSFCAARSRARLRARRFDASVLPSEVARQASRAVSCLSPPRSDGLVLVRERSTRPHDRGVEKIRRQSAARGTASRARRAARPTPRSRRARRRAADAARARTPRAPRRPSRRRRGAPARPAPSWEKRVVLVVQRGRTPQRERSTRKRCCRIARRTRRSRALTCSSRRTPRSSLCAWMAADDHAAPRFSIRAAATTIQRFRYAPSARP